jgi:hypothetical protein
MSGGIIPLPAVDVGVVPMSIDDAVDESLAQSASAADPPGNFTQ